MDGKHLKTAKQSEYKQVLDQLVQRPVLVLVSFPKCYKGGAPGVPFLEDVLVSPVLLSPVRLRQICSGGGRLKWLIPSNQAPIQTDPDCPWDTGGAPALSPCPQSQPNRMLNHCSPGLHIHGAGSAPREVSNMNGFLALPPQPPADEGSPSPEATGGLLLINPGRSFLLLEKVPAPAWRLQAKAQLCLRCPTPRPGKDQS